MGLRLPDRYDAKNRPHWYSYHGQGINLLTEKSVPQVAAKPPAVVIHIR